MLVIGRVEHDDALRRAAGLADAFDRAADKLSAIGDEHDLVGVLHRENGHQRPVAFVDGHRDDAFAAASGDPVLEG